MKSLSYHLFHHGLFLLSFLFSCIAISITNISTDQSALLALRDHMMTSKPYQNFRNNWSITSSVCDWIGVTCGFRHRRVTSLNISNMGLTGKIPPELGNLSFLVSLDMSRNNLHGQLPNELVHLRRLKLLDFGVNNLSGELPSWFSIFKKLQYLSLTNNSFTGFIPHSITNMSNLKTIWLSFNSLEGRIPVEIGNLHNLKNLLIDYNLLSGAIPRETGNLTSLKLLSFIKNRLTGTIPQELGNLQNLDELYVGANILSGFIPFRIFNLSRIRAIALNSNHLSGNIPLNMMGNVEMLEALYVYNNNLRGKIPEEVCDLSNLKVLQMENNQFTGPIPKCIGKLAMLKGLLLGFNILTGAIPAGIFNMSMLEHLTLLNNNLSGGLPSTTGHQLRNLQVLLLDNNNLNGVIPPPISNASKLAYFTISNNKFSGPIPSSIGDLTFLYYLDVSQNYLTSNPSSSELSFITFLSNCKQLKKLGINENPFRTVLPVSIANLSSSIERIYAYGCEIKGNIPESLGNLSNLLIFAMHRNHLTGSIPRAFKDLQKLQALSLGDNQLSGPIPKDLCNLKKLFGIYLRINQISGSIPSCFGNITSLRYIYMDRNLFNNSIPASLWNLRDLLELDVSYNSLSGSVPQEMANLKAAVRINISANHISGNIPTTIGGLESLVGLSLSLNKLQGQIPDSFGHLLSLQFLDLSHNNLSGSIPKSLEALLYLHYVNFSFNKLQGEIPSGGPFENFASQSFMYNDALCGAPRFLVPPCSPSPFHRSTKKKMLQVTCIVSGVVIVALILAILSLRYGRKNKVPRAVDLSLMKRLERVGYYELLHATDGYNASNLLGTGSFGSVYRGTLIDGTQVAVKVFKLQMEGMDESFLSECEVLPNLRHRNLTKVIGSCINHDFKALLFEYMSNGSLEKRLYSHNHFLDLKQRINIMIDVASALEYLHYGYTTPVVHCDIKPSNILLDEGMVAHLTDFGLAKFLSQEESNFHTKTLATLGYIAPEYGLEGLVSTRSDVYSFGIVLMETFSRMKPSDQMFSGDLSLKSWMENSLHNGIKQAIDANLLSSEDTHHTKKLESISLILQLALSCCNECPRDRTSMKDVVISLEKIKHQLVSVYGDQM